MDDMPNRSGGSKSPRQKYSLRRIVLVILAAVSVIVFLGPFLVPVPPLQDTVPPQELADPDSRFLDVDGVTIHYKTEGENQPVMILLHGFGASVFSWREVMAPLAQLGTVIAYDRPAFGLTERPLDDEWSGINPYSPEGQVALLKGLMDGLDVDSAILIGNSAGGTVALDMALAHPDRVQGLVLVDAAVYGGGGTPPWVRPILNTPQVEHLGPLLVRQIEARGDAFLDSAWHDPSQITPEIRDGYRKPLRVQNWDRALWELVQASRQSTLNQRLPGVNAPSLVITGDDDRIVPTEQSLRLADELPSADLVVLPQCGHLPHEECPQPFLTAVQSFVVKNMAR